MAEQGAFGTRVNPQPLPETQHQPSGLRPMSVSAEAQKVTAIIHLMAAVAILAYCMAYLCAFISAAIPFTLMAFWFSYRGFVRGNKEMLITASYFHYLTEIYLIVICVFWAAMFAEQETTFRIVHDKPIYGSKDSTRYTFGTPAYFGCAFYALLVISTQLLIFFQRQYRLSLHKNPAPSDMATVESAANAHFRNDFGSQQMSLLDTTSRRNLQGVQRRSPLVVDTAAVDPQPSTSRLPSAPLSEADLPQAQPSTEENKSHDSLPTLSPDTRDDIANLLNAKQISALRQYES